MNKYIVKYTNSQGEELYKLCETFYQAYHYLVNYYNEEFEHNFSEDYPYEQKSNEIHQKNMCFNEGGEQSPPSFFSVLVKIHKFRG